MAGKGQNGTSQIQSVLPLSAESGPVRRLRTEVIASSADRTLTETRPGDLHRRMRPSGRGLFNIPRSVHIERRIFLEYVAGRDQCVLRHCSWRQSLPGQQAQGERQHVVTVAVDVIRDRAEHDTDRKSTRL